VNRIAALFAAAALIVSCGAPATSSPRARTSPPRLIVFITVDQFHPGYLARYRSEFTGGLKRLLDGGAYFTDAFQDHAITETAPGHATTMSGRYPSSTGITRNLLGVNDPRWPLIGAPRDLGAAPFRFRGTTLTDWLVAKDPRTKVLSVSQKDRAAILPIGRSKQQVYWYGSNGTFTTSTWYADTLPSWVRQFNVRRIPARAAGTEWTLLRPASQYPEKDSVPVENFGRNVVFPHRVPADTARAEAFYLLFPMMDELDAAFALDGVGALGLGQGPETDLLAVSFSATDQIGHRFGPESREIHDQILRLDRTMGQFIDSLYRLVDSSEVIFALTADHAVGPIPELHGHLRVDMAPAMAATRAAVAKAGGDTTAIDLESGAFFAAPAVRSVAMEAFIQAARRIPGVGRVDRFDELDRVDTTKDVIARRWLHMFPDDLAPQVVVTLDEGDIWDYPIVATHGSPHDFDAHVPMIFYGPPFKPGRYGGEVRVVDMAPTLAAIAGVKPAERLDGHVLEAAFR
jgi:predicted AlkP superfamily pyrophosphatase or phosphodiesterase